MKKDTIAMWIDKMFPRLLITALVLYIYKKAFWPLSYPFVITEIFILVLFVVRSDWNLYLKIFIKAYKLPLLLVVVILLVAIINSDFKNTLFLKDLLLIIILFSFVYFSFWTFSIRKIDFPLEFAIKLVIYITLFISIVNLVFNLSLINIPLGITEKLHISLGNTLSDDYNFYCLLIILGFLLLNTPNTLSKYFNNSKSVFVVFNLLFLSNIIFSTSRRGIFALTVILIYYAYIGIKNTKRIDTRKIITVIGILFISSILITVSGRYFIKHVSSEKLSIMVFRYSNFFGNNNYEEINKKLWEPSNKIPKILDSTSMIKVLHIDPDKWRTVNSFAKINKLQNGIEVRLKSKSSENIKIYPKINGQIYFATHTYSIRFKIKPLKGNVNNVSCGWWTDDGNMGNRFTNASIVQLESTVDGWYDYHACYTFMDNHIGTVIFLNFFSPEGEYLIRDFTVKDDDYDHVLAKQVIEADDSNQLMNWLNKINPLVKESGNLLMNGDFRYGLKFWGYSADSLKINVHESDSQHYARISRGDGNAGYFSLFYAGRRIVFVKDNQYELSFRFKPITPQNVPFYVGYWIDEGDGYLFNLKQHIDTLNDGWFRIKTYYTFKNTLGNLVFPINSQADNSEFLITGISLKNLSSNQDISYVELIVDTSKVQTALLSGRDARLQYAREIWKNDYKWYNKLFGNGFEYYRWFGSKFLNDPDRGDYPHNPFVSVLLYSGVLGFCLFCWFLFHTFSLYYKYRQQLRVLMMSFFVTFFFSFFSASSPFDPPIMGVFMLVPYFINHMQRGKHPL